MTTSQFDSAADGGEQRREAAVLGMWAFLATELLFFGPNHHYLCFQNLQIYAQLWKVPSRR